MALKTPTTTIIDDSLVAVLDETYVKTMTVQEFIPYATGEVTGYNSGGSVGTITSSIVQFPFSTPFTSATSTGSLSTTKSNGAGQSSETHGYFATGSDIDRFPFATTPVTGVVVGNLSQSRSTSAGQSSATNGYTSGGVQVPTILNRIDSFPFSTPFQNAVNVGNLSNTRRDLAGHSSLTHGYSSGGEYLPGTPSNRIDRFPFSTPFVTATNVASPAFNGLSGSRRNVSGQSSSTYGYTSGGTNPPTSTAAINTIDRFPFSTPFTSATDIGDISSARWHTASQSSTTNGYNSGGMNTPSTYVNTIDSFPFSTPFQTATSVGNLGTARSMSVGQQD